MESISTDLAAVLLFLIAEAPSDASEIAGTFDAGNAFPIETSLISAIRSLAEGNLVAIAEAAMPSRNAVREVASRTEAALVAYQAKKQGRENWLNEQIDAAVQFYNGQMPESDDEIAEHQVSAKLGVSLAVVSRLSAEIKDEETRTVLEWTTWFFDWMAKNPDLFDQMLRPTTVDDLLGSAINKIKDPTGRAKVAVPILQKLTSLWLSGKPLSELQSSLGTDVDKLKACLDARKFALRVISDLAYLFGIPAFLIQNRHALKEYGSQELLAGLAKLGACIRLGFESVDLIALGFSLRGERPSRRQVHERFAAILPHLKAAPPGETWDAAVDRIARAQVTPT